MSIEHPTTVFAPAERLGQLPPYLFVELDRLKNEAKSRGEDVINLGIGDPDLPTPQVIIDAMKEATRIRQTISIRLVSAALSFGRKSPLIMSAPEMLCLIQLMK